MSSLAQVRSRPAAATTYQMRNTPQSSKKRQREDIEIHTPTKRVKARPARLPTSDQELRHLEPEDVTLYDDIEGAHNPFKSSKRKKRSNGRSPAKGTPLQGQNASPLAESSRKKRINLRDDQQSRVSDVLVEDGEHVRESPSGKKAGGRMTSQRRATGTGKQCSDDEIINNVREKTTGLGLIADGHVGFKNVARNGVRLNSVEGNAVCTTPTRKRRRPEAKASIKDDTVRPEHATPTSGSNQRPAALRFLAELGDTPEYVKVKDFPQAEYNQAVEEENAARNEQLTITPTPKTKKKRVSRLLTQLADTPEYAKAKALPRTEYDDFVNGDIYTEDTLASVSRSHRRRRRAQDEDNEDDVSVNDAIGMDTPSKTRRLADPQEMEVIETDDELVEGTLRRRAVDRDKDDIDNLDADEGPHVSKLQLTAKAPRQRAPKLQPKPIPLPPDCERQVEALREVVLSKLCRSRPIPLVGLDEEYAKIHTLLHATVTAGESNSLLLIGARGSGKTSLVNAALHELRRGSADDFHVVRLSGFIHTDDKIALRDIWIQLGREMEIEEEEAKGPGKSYADTLAMLLALLSHPDELSTDRGTQGDEKNVSKSVIFVMDEFDLFAMHPRQTLLYNLFDIAQSRKAPIAVLGLTTRIDVMDGLEKRVKSRFSHRYVHVGLPKSVASFNQIVKAALHVGPAELDFDERAQLLGRSGQKEAPHQGNSNTLTVWNAAIDALFTHPPFLRSYILPTYHISKSVPMALSSFIIPVSNVRSGTDLLTHFTLPLHEPSSTTTAHAALLLPPHSNLSLLPSLSDVALSLLIAASRLEILHGTPQTNFSLAYTEYVSLLSKARLLSSSSTPSTAANLSSTRVFGKDVARREWERLLDAGLLIPATGEVGASVGRASLRVGENGMVRVDVALEEIPGAVRLSATMERWCKQL